MKDVTFEESLLRFEQQHVFMMNVVLESFKWPDGQSSRTLGWQYGGHFIDKSELHLTEDEKRIAARQVMNSITYLLTSQICEAMKRLKPPPREHPQVDIASAYEMSRMIRNAFAHDPGVPTWSIDPHCANKTFEVPGIMKLNTAFLQGQPVVWQDYGGSSRFIGFRNGFGGTCFNDRKARRPPRRSLPRGKSEERLEGKPVKTFYGQQRNCKTSPNYRLRQ